MNTDRNHYKTKFINIEILLQCDICPQCECQNRTFNVKKRNSASVRMLKQDFARQNTKFSLRANVA